MADKPTSPTESADPNIKVFTETPEKRAEIIAGLRAMAQFIEDNPLVPCPDSVREQYSYSEPLDLRTFERVPVPNEEKVAFVQRVAALLGTGAEVDIDAERAVLQYAVAPKTTYIVHAKLRGGEQA